VQLFSLDEGKTGMQNKTRETESGEDNEMWQRE
jgi:hypothetical protein